MATHRPQKTDRLKPISLYPLTPEEALGYAMSAPPMNGVHRSAKASSARASKPRKRTKPKK